MATPTKTMTLTEDLALPETTQPNWQGAPDLVIEVISEAEPHPPTPFSPRRRGQKSPLYRRGDLGVRRKYDLYQRAGVREYWIVEPRDGSVEVFQRTAQGFRRVGIFYADDTLTSLLLNASLPLQGVLSSA